MIFVVIVVLVAGLAFAASRRAPDAGDEGTVTLVANDFEFSNREIQAPAGEVTVAFANTDAVPHTFTVSDLGVDELLGSGEARQFSFTAEPGRYEYICTIPGHDSPGMRGVLTVTHSPRS